MQVKVLQVGPIGTNCYLLEDEKAHVAAVIDPGDEAGRILQVIKERRRGREIHPADPRPL